MNPAQNLAGTTVNHVWVVDEKIDLKADDSTGGFFSIPYRVHHKGTSERGFLKVLDVFKAIQGYSAQGIDVAESLNRLTSAHIFEVKLMNACGTNRFDRVVRALDSGEISLPVPIIGSIRFPFLVCELADGDTHTVRKTMAGLDLVWWFRTLHQVAIGLQQLHKIKIAHQDLKPSNVVFFGTKNAKLTDLGRAVMKDLPSRNDNRQCPGAIAHAPPEKIFGHIPHDWDARHLATDLYHLGSLAFAHFVDIPMTTAVIQKLPPGFWPPPFNSFSGTAPYTGRFEDALPSLEYAFSSVLSEFVNIVPGFLCEILAPTLKQLCHPAPEMRGHPEDRAMACGQRYSVERYISVFRRLSMLAENAVIK